MRGTQLVVLFPKANQKRSVVRRRRPARRHTRKRSGHQIESCCNPRSAAVPQRLRGAGCQPWCVCVQYGISLAQELLRRVSNALIREAEACAHAGSRSPPLPRRAATGDRSVQPPGISPAKYATPPPGLRSMPSCTLCAPRPEKYAAPRRRMYVLRAVLHTSRIAPRKVCSASLAYVRTTGRIAYFAYFSYFFENIEREREEEVEHNPPPLAGE